MSAVRSPLLSDAFRWLVPVRGAGPSIHFVYEEQPLAGHPLRGRSLCGQDGPLDKHGDPKFRAVYGTSGDKICNACQAEACRQATRVRWKR